MDNRKFKILLAFSVLLSAGNLLCSAHDFSVVDNDGKKYFFNVTDTLKNTVELTYEGRITRSDDTFAYDGELQIPSMVKYRNEVYRVASIGPKAFAGCDDITGIVIPSGVVEIKDFAFDGCSSLNKIIFPANSVKMGEGVFFRCAAIRNITLGSDWSVVDFKVFAWSDSLSTVYVPARVKTIKNLKSLESLSSIEVDRNNSNFTSVDGVLYNKDVTVMYGCPRNLEGGITVPEGVESILAGAIYDCKKVVSVDLPSSLCSISYREFSGMDSLTQIYMRSETPVLTAKVGDEDVFALAAPKSRNVTLFVPKNSLKEYKSEVYSESAEYGDPDGKNKRNYSADEMVGIKNIKGVKSF